MNTLDLRAERLRREPALKAARLMLECFAEGDQAVIEAFIERGGKLFGEEATREQLARFSKGRWQCTGIDELPPVVSLVIDLVELAGVEPDCVVLAQVSNGTQERTLGLAIVDDAPVSIFDPRPIARMASKEAIELSKVLMQVS
ncbi:MAG: hypothetical protein ACAI38_17400 [Myxococcota bacterium]